MSDDILSVIPADPHRQPAPDAGKRAAALVLEPVSGSPDDAEPGDVDDVDLDVDWYEAITAVDCGSNLVSIRCRVSSRSRYHSGAMERSQWGDPQRPPLTPEELTTVGRALGHPVRQIPARI
ncbi:hypothetical protein ABB07_14995 [Streptomyces incarnatus]|uniref:Uncharacterized protein n=1 Tax=Streptomyces incarnatus TaxID=665007 RepID=A0ABN4GJ09_9ACTN|nr:hypothetical protein [Streptomyces incarnatus]AKJ11286.1 hypothetical protein ABB07_14995 [Streptomyces incarnatus]